jgi:hypothetical protein
VIALVPIIVVLFIWGQSAIILNFI